MTGLPISVNWKDNSYDSILVIIDRLIKIVYYESVIVIIDAPSLAKMIIGVVVCYYEVSKSIVINRDLLFTSNFSFLLCYFLGIQKKLFIAFYPETKGKAKK